MDTFDLEIKLAQEYDNELKSLLEGFRGGKYDEGQLKDKLKIAERHLGKFKSQYPDRSAVIVQYEAWYHYRKGLFYYMCGLYKEGDSNLNTATCQAINQLDEAISLWDTHRFRSLRAKFYKDLRRYDKALIDLAEILQDPESEWYFTARKYKDEIDLAKEKAFSCFIATAVYGSPDAPEVRYLRQFRDETLVHSWLGRRFVAAYYRISPPLARGLAARPTLSRFVRKRLLDPAVALLRKV